MTNANLATTLLSLGFVEGERDPKNPANYADLGTPVTGLWYGHRVYQGQWQYVSLCSYLGEFVEAVILVYQTRFNSRQKSQQTALFSGISRSEDHLDLALGKVYDLPKKS